MEILQNTAFILYELNRGISEEHVYIMECAFI